MDGNVTDRSFIVCISRTYILDILCAEGLGGKIIKLYGQEWPNESKNKGLT